MEHFIVNVNNKEEEKAVKFVEHLKEHKEVKEAPVNAGIPICKICNKTIDEIYEEQKPEKAPTCATCNKPLKKDTSYTWVHTCGCTDIKLATLSEQKPEEMEYRLKKIKCVRIGESAKEDFKSMMTWNEEDFKKHTELIKEQKHYEVSEPFVLADKINKYLNKLSEMSIIQRRMGLFEILREHHQKVKRDIYNFLNIEESTSRHDLNEGIKEIIQKRAGNL